jgi:dipeptidyl aminopeptidase/acylaminoacyl peptidase
MSERDGRVAFVAATPTSPGEIHVLDANGERQVTHLLATALPDVELIEPEGRTFHAPDGAEIEGWILRARSASGRTPLLVDIHGGPHNAWGPVFDGVHVWQQTLADQGWTILVINPRGSDGYGETFWSSLLADGWGHADEQDFHAAIDALIEEGLADPEQVALTGYSYGGYMSCWLTARSDRFAAAVAGGSVTDLVGEAGTSDLGWYLDMIEFGRDVYDNQAWVADRSPITHVHRARTPTLLLHGEDDLRCPIGQAEQWFAALRSRGVPTQLVRYPGAGHLFILSGRPSHRVDYCRRVEEWVTSHVGARATARA